MRNRLAASLLMTSCLVLPGLAMAQDKEAQNPNITVQERSRPDFDPLGIRAGSFLIYPTIGLEALYDSNIFATNDNEDSDLAAVLTPRVRAVSNFSRHRLALDVGGELAAFVDDQDNNYGDVYGKATGQVEITRRNLLNANLGVSRVHEDRDSPDITQDQNDYVYFMRDDLGLSYRHVFNRLYAQVGGQLTRLDFSDQNGINNDDRDRNQFALSLRSGYELSPRFNVFGEGIYDLRRYDNTPDDTGRDRDSDGFSLRAGTEIDITSIIFGEFAAGYTYRTYDDDNLDSVGGPSVSSTITWNVTPLTSIVFDAQAEILESTVTFEGDEASGDFRKRIGVDVTHELLRNVLLNANAGYVRDDFEGTDRSDDSVLLGAGVSYLLNRNLSLDATYDFTTRNSDADQEEFDRSVVRLGVTAKL